MNPAFVCPECGKPLEQVYCKSYSTYTWNGVVKEYSENDPYYWDVEYTCPECDANITKEFQRFIDHEGVDED